MGNTESRGQTKSKNTEFMNNEQFGEASAKRKKTQSSRAFPPISLLRFNSLQIPEKQTTYHFSKTQSISCDEKCPEEGVIEPNDVLNHSDSTYQEKQTLENKKIFSVFSEHFQCFQKQLRTVEEFSLLEEKETLVKNVICEAMSEFETRDSIKASGNEDDTDIVSMAEFQSLRPFVTMDDCEMMWSQSNKSQTIKNRFSR